MRLVSPAFVAVCLALVPVCIAAAPPKSEPLPPGCVEVQHVLVGFDGAPRIKPPGRTLEQAGKLAEELLDRARKGENFAALVKKYSSDGGSGIYGMCDSDQALPKGFVPRGSMVPGFGDVAFGLKPGEFGLAVYDAQKSPYGWHLIKRLR